MKKLVKMIIASSIAAIASSCAPSQPNIGPTSVGMDGPPQHILMLVDVGGGVYTRGCLKSAFSRFISSRVHDLNKGDSVCIVAYSSDAGYYPPSTVPNKTSDIIEPIQGKIDESRAYWRTEHKKHGPLASASRAYVRLDKALELGLKDRDSSWPTNGKVSLVFLTDGGAGMRSETKDPAKEKQEVEHFRNEISRQFQVLTHDPRLSDVTLYGVYEQENDKFPNGLYPRSVMDQWLNVWLKDAPNVKNLRMETD